MPRGPLTLNDNDVAVSLGHELWHDHPPTQCHCAVQVSVAPPPAVHMHAGHSPPNFGFVPTSSAALAISSLAEVALTGLNIKPGSGDAAGGPGCDFG